jgi:hypothetical protein
MPEKTIKYFRLIKFQDFVFLFYIRSKLLFRIKSFNLCFKTFHFQETATNKNYYYCLTVIDITAQVSGEQKCYFHLWGLHS